MSELRGQMDLDELMKGKGMVEGYDADGNLINPQTFAGGEGNRQEATGEAGETTSSVTASPRHLPQGGRLLEEEPATEAQTSAAADPFDLDALLGGL